MSFFMKEIGINGTEISTKDVLEGICNGSIHCNNFSIEIKWMCEF